MGSPLDTGNETKLSAENVEKIAHIGLLAHKYEFSAIEQWAINICQELPTAEVLMGFPLENLKYLAHVVTHCEWQGVKEKLDSMIITGVSREERPSAIATASTLRNAIHIADHIGDERLRADAYYAYLQNTHWDLHPRERKKQKVALQLDDIGDYSTVEPLSNLSEQQRLSLFRGFSSLQTLRNRLRYMPVIEPFPAACDTTHEWRSCSRNWSSWWSGQAERLDRLVSMDGPWDFLATMIKRIAVDPPSLPAHGNAPVKECVAHVQAQLAEMKEAFEHDLPNYFA